ncbi:MAG: ferritin family protein [Candidatus Scalinduaceae bacterium]
MNESHYEHMVADIIERSIEIECKAGELYAKLSMLFSHFPEISTLWDKLAKDEILHMKTLQDIYDSMTREQLLSHIDKQMWKNIVKIQNLMNTNLAGSIKNLDDAYELAHQIEFSEINEIFKSLVTINVLPEEQEQLVLSNVMRHQNDLSNFGRKYENRTLRKRISIQHT